MLLKHTKQQHLVPGQRGAYVWKEWRLSRPTTLAPPCRSPANTWSSSSIGPWNTSSLPQQGA